MLHPAEHRDGWERTPVLAALPLVLTTPIRSAGRRSLLNAFFTAHAVVLLALQLAVILSCTFICGRLAELVRQPRVVGEIVGGLLLGPLALGRVSAGAYAVLFPASALHPLEVISSFGLVIFLFMTGAELDIAAVRRNRGATLAITLGNIGVPFALGIAFSPMLRSEFALKQVSATGFTLFAGIAMSITALPVLARIIEERRATKRPIDPQTAATALVCAAMNDLLAWSLLAIALTFTHIHQRGYSMKMTGMRLGWLLVYIAVMLQVLRPLIKKLLARYGRQGLWFWVVGSVAFAWASAQITDALGVHAFFGAFLAGTCVPVVGGRGAAVEAMYLRWLRPIVNWTLPIFFAMTGLRMHANVNVREEMDWFALILAIAMVGKILGAMLPAKAAGMRWRRAAEMGFLMNTRGLVELIVLNVGLKEGIISPVLFTLFVLMALVTTASTVPLLDLLGGARGMRLRAIRAGSKGAQVGLRE